MSSDPRPTRRPALDRAGVVAAARDSIAKEGYEAFSLRQLASQLGVTAPALYAHVRGKKELIRAVAEMEFGRFTKLLEKVDLNDPLERIREGARVYVNFARENPEIFRLMFRFRPVITEEPRGDEFDAATRSFQRGAASIRQAMDAGALRNDDQ